MTKLKILKQLHQCENNDFLPNTICYMDNVVGVEITLIQSRKVINKAEQRLQRIRRIQREQKMLPVIKFISYDEWIADNYFERTLNEK